MPVRLNIVRGFCAIALAAAPLVLPVDAVSAQQRMTLEEGADYVHPHSGITVPATLGGIPRTAATAFAPNDLNLGISFDTQGSAEALSVYIYRVTQGSVPVWFAQAQRAIELRPAYANPRLAFSVASFTPNGQPNASGLRAVYDTEGSQFTSTGVAMFALNGWYVKIRASSVTQSAEELRDWMDEAIAELTMPAGTTPEASPVEPCPNQLTFPKKKSKDVKKNKGENSAFASLIGSLVAQAAAAQKEGGETDPDAPAPEPVIYCKDREVAAGRILYRADASEDSYLFALSDSGVEMTVAPDTLGFILSEGKAEKPNYAVKLHLADRDISYRLQDRMPRPERVMQLLDKNQTVGSTSTWGDNSTITIDPDSL
ncbi:MAG: hypothetical protein SXU28_01520 [Pseudomonadota bacterium]|nr:hypothetical protein [Pseudomonadota bacterium]